MAQRGGASTRRHAGGGGPAVGLPRADRITTVDHRLRALRRFRARLQCLMGRHLWARHSNPEVGGARAVYHLCRRCGRERVRRMRPSDYFAR